ncbi:hypothetical protein LJ725_17485 [Reyranella aquatilis]|uniref:DUF2125 domain-containing protein n=1 Tax=Reyranella aquatilis TaxID=2035356 RepID=A0ABS8KYF0_9HYPH|nr:hypothetical protein [Reyranella aquatilis]MCC8430767.1 hypothetical protein [Reyranella aquatilis]
MRIVFAALLSALLWIGLAAGASAQNGLERFEKDIKPQFELKKFSYGSAQPVGAAGFVLNDVVAVVPANAATGDKESTVRIDKVTVEALDFDRLKKDAKDDLVPRFAKLRMEGITGDDELFSALEPYGVPRVPFDVALDYRLDPDTKVLTLDMLEVALRGQARLALSMVLDGVSDMANAKDDARLRSASLTIDDKELFAKLIPAAAQEEGITAEELVTTALDALGGFAQVQSGETLKALDAVASFVADWKAPKGPIVLGLKPAKTAGLDDLDKIMMPNGLSTFFGFTATYPGTKPGAAQAGARK